MDGKSFKFVVEYFNFFVSLEKLSSVLGHFWAITDMGHLRGFTTWSQHFSFENQAKVKQKKQWVLKIDDSYGWFFSLSSQMCTISTACESSNALSTPALHLQ